MRSLLLFILVAVAIIAADSDPGVDVAKVQGIIDHIKSFVSTPEFGNFFVDDFYYHDYKHNKYNKAEFIERCRKMPQILNRTVIPSHCKQRSNCEYNGHIYFSDFRLENYHLIRSGDGLRVVGDGKYQYVFIQESSCG